MRTNAQDELDQAQLSYLSLLLDNGCQFQFRTNLFGKDYVWMRDRFGAIFLERIPSDKA